VIKIIFKILKTKKLKKIYGPVRVDNFLKKDSYIGYTNEADFLLCLQNILQTDKLPRRSVGIVTKSNFLFLYFPFYQINLMLTGRPRI
jgi:hypothetical protein